MEEGIQGISKGVPTNSEPIIITHTPATQIGAKEPDVPYDIFRFFAINNDTLDTSVTKKLKDISDWTFKGVETLGDGLMKLKDLEVKLGSPRPNEARYDKIYNWVLVQRDIEELQKKQKAMQ